MVSNTKAELRAGLVSCRACRGLQPAAQEEQARVAPDGAGQVRVGVSGGVAAPESGRPECQVKCGAWRDVVDRHCLSVGYSLVLDCMSIDQPGTGA